MIPTSQVSPTCKYRMITELGRGGMGEVCLALAQGVAGFKKLVAVKRARPDLADFPEFVTMFLDEARLAARLNHPNVVQTYEAGREGDTYFIAMEYLEGQPLHRIRARVGPAWFPLAMEIRILIEALAGLHYAHELADYDGTPLGVVHRDATPQNIFVTYDGQIKVVDFGIAKAQSSMLKTRPGTLKGKVTYMPPEQARRRPLDRRADIFAFGVMLWEAIAGERMWAGFFDSQILRRLEAGKIPKIKARPPNDDPELLRICHRALAPEPENRYATAAELQHALERWLARQGEEITARMVGRFVAAHFDEERSSIKALLEQDLRESAAIDAPRTLDMEATIVESKAPSRSVAREEIGDSTSIPTLPAPPPLDVPITTRSPSMDPVLPEPPPPTSRRCASPLSTRSQEPPEEKEDTMRISSVSIDFPERPELPRPSPRGSRRLWAFGGAALVAGSLAIAALRIGGLLPPVGGAQAVQARASEVNLTIRVQPGTARIFVDGMPVAAGSYAGVLPKDGRSHQIRAEAPSFVPMEQSITASSDVFVSLGLEREPAR